MRTLPGIMPAAAVLLLGIFSMGFSQEIPTPEDYLGFTVGADFHLADYDQAIGYFRALEQSSPRIKLFEAGTTTMGRPHNYAVITSEENMAELDRYKDIARRLSLARGLTDDDARRLAAEGKAIVYIDGGLHATEVAPAQHLIQLAYDLVADDDSFIRDNTILILVFANPDGMNMVAEWYRSNLGTPFEVSPLPRLYQKYVGHDNNRDSYMLNMNEAQNINRILNREWYPVVMYNHHQVAPFPTRIYIPPSAEPTNDNMHPLVIRGRNLFGTSMGLALDEEGKTGAISRVHFDLWYPGYVDEIGLHFNIISLMTETALYRYATPRFYTVDEFPEDFRDFTKSSFYPSPWKGGWWRLRDAVEYTLTTSKTVLRTAAQNSEELLYNKYQMGRDNITRFEHEPPYAWIIPQKQWDPPTANLLLQKMMSMGIEVYETDNAFVADGIPYSAGTRVIPMNQPFSLFVKTMFEAQHSPDLSALPKLWQGTVDPREFTDVYLPHQDMDGWTLPYQMGVTVRAAATPLDVPLIRLDSVAAPPGTVSRSAGQAYLISPQTNNAFIAVNRILKAGGDVMRAQDSFSAGGTSYLPGTWIIPSHSVSKTLVNSLADELHLTIGGTGRPVPGGSYPVSLPTTGLYRPWRANIDEGWTRWLFEQFEFPFSNIRNADIIAGDLQNRFDVIVIPSMSTNVLLEGFKKGTVPPGYAGGITEAGVINLKKFVEEGKTLVTLNMSSHFAIEKLGIDVADSLRSLTQGWGEEPAPGEQQRSENPDFSISGSILRMEFDQKHPVAFGMPEEAPAFFNNSPAFVIRRRGDDSEGNDPLRIAWYPDGKLLMSGFQVGEEHLHTTNSAVEAPLGKGRIVLLGFGVQNRAQPHGTFKLLFNSLYYSTMR